MQPVLDFYYYTIPCRISYDYDRGTFILSVYYPTSSPVGTDTEPYAPDWDPDRLARLPVDLFPSYDFTPHLLGVAKFVAVHHALRHMFPAF